MQEPSSLPRYTTAEPSRLTTIVAEIQHARSHGAYEHIQQLLDDEMPAVWFSHDHEALVALIEELMEQLPRVTPTVQGFYAIFSGSDAPIQVPTARPSNGPSWTKFHKLFFETMSARVQGRMVASLEHAERLNKSMQELAPIITNRAGWRLHIPIQLGNSALLAGDFSRALTAFTQAQFHAPLRSFEFLTRDALLKAAMLHGFFGNNRTAQAHLDRSRKIPRTTSWVEPQLDVVEDFVHIMIDPESQAERLSFLEDIAPHDVGEMWPFYIFLMTRRLQEAGRREELENHLHAFDAMPLPRHDGDGFAGSVIPVSLALLALQRGDLARARTLLARADARLPFTQLFLAAAHIYRGRPKQAIADAWKLYDDTRAFRILEIRRLAILASAHWQIDDPEGSVHVLRQAAQLPEGLHTHEVIFFSPETRHLAEQRVPNWPSSSNQPSVFLTSIPEPVKMLSPRQIEIIEALAQGHTRAVISKNLNITMNTVKSQLRAIYTKLGVTTRDDAVQAVRDRGLIDL